MVLLHQPSWAPDWQRTRSTQRDKSEAASRIARLVGLVEGAYTRMTTEKRKYHREYARKRRLFQAKKCRCRRCSWRKVIAGYTVCERCRLLKIAYERRRRQEHTRA